MPRRHRQIPSYRLHKPTGQAVVRLNGHDYYLGKHGTPASQEAYDRLIAEWLATGQHRTPTATLAAPPSLLTVGQLVLAFWQYAQQHYKKPDGTPTGELGNLRDALRPLRKLYSRTPADTFGPLALRAVQQEMIQAGLCRTTVNARVNRIRRVFKWAVGVELLPPTVYQALQAVPGLQRGRSAALESDKIVPVPAEHVEATLPYLPRPVCALVQLQRLTGCRAEEILPLRGCDLTLQSPLWEYRPQGHKNQWRGQERVILLGPRAQAILRDFLKTDLQAYLFSPQDVVNDLHTRRRVARRSKRTPSELARGRRSRPQCQPGPCYTRRSYRQAIVRACNKAGVPEWTPLQLRHTRATEIRAQYGLEAAQLILGHSKADVTQVYAERDRAKAQAIVTEIG